MKKILLIVLAISFLFCGNILPQKRSSGYKSSYKFKSNYNYKAPKLKIPSTFKSPTYKIGGTKYKYGETYKSTGLPKVERSSTTKRQFLKSRGYNKEPKGFEVDHIIPLSQGGQDVPSNMQLIPKEVHKQKTASERQKK